MNRYYKLLCLILLVGISFKKINADSDINNSSTPLTALSDAQVAIKAETEDSEEETDLEEAGALSEEAAANDTENAQELQPKKSPLYLIDTIKVVVFGDDRTDLITELDCMRPSLDGQKRSLEDLILEDLIFQDAVRYKMLPTEESITRHLMSVQREHNLSLDDIKNIFGTAGYSFDEGKEKFGVMSAVGQMLDFKIRSRLIVPEKDIESYYKEHPVYTDETYELANALIKREEDQSLDEMRAEIEQFMQTGDSSLQVTWSEPFWVKADEISPNRQFIKGMITDQIAIAAEIDDGIEIIKLMNKQERRLLTLEERYHDVADTLRQPKYEEMFNNYRKELFGNASLIYF